MQDGFNPLLVTGIGVVGDAQCSIPQGDGIRLLPEFLPLLWIVFEDGLVLQIIGVSGDGRRRIINCLDTGAIEELLDDQVSIDGQADGLTAKYAFLPAEMLQAFGNADALCLGTGRGEHFHILILLIGRVGGGGNLIQKIEVTGLNISVCRVQGRIEPEVDATVLRGEVALVIVITNDLRALSMLPGNELIGTVANRLLAIRFRILIIGWAARSPARSD